MNDKLIAKTKHIAIVKRDNYYMVSIDDGFGIGWNRFLNRDKAFQFAYTFLKLQNKAW